MTVKEYANKWSLAVRSTTYVEEPNGEKICVSKTCNNQLKLLQEIFELFKISYFEYFYGASIRTIN